jgi:hypothetical protein
MSSKQGMKWLAAWALLAGLNATAMAASVSVVVSSNSVSVDPNTLSLSPTDDAINFQLGTAGYVFPSSNAVVIDGGGFSCRTVSSGASVSCRRAKGAANPKSFRVNVQPASGSGAPVPKSSSDIWVVSE